MHNSIFIIHYYFLFFKYNGYMGKNFKKSGKSKRNITLSPKGASVMFKQEIVDSQGNKHINLIKFEPQNPFKPDFTQTVEYKK